MKADVTVEPHHLGGGTINVVVQNPEHKFDGTFTRTFVPSTVDTVQLVTQLRGLADDIENYAQAFDDKLQVPPKSA